ncbi:MacB family efflux pump subunit [Vibrio atlanticus]|uniref:MacB family efflux pump subunit n=1 Tax=Vibrio cyclitrophicus TaxID=47951 RepID=UPI0002D2F6F6|nr:MacB family efflux pump subunit [Vibrio cyclitrophicus]MBY7659598.1 MacB family efflux pump subunit [Vibrio atlanticus]ERM58162.1 Macrolide export ATP-binding/permease protein MacB [Vibrio cyclitrophicus FF75]OBT06122.1 macrolide ABC transporter permease/ATP-binding protein MacB [Vibrio cyclitrophicus]OEE02282.1 macrolide ABC transporter permease/ATP-binding protein MacB [Vibrio cyclitrophicus ZF28]OEE45844.1 macrolide ABC transporter permease/ATP-binding protein MacB [Vibrio cyclitrophicus|tara:strand:- start:847 stop:2823 length:1977 start_codon:yes stop_codon:yes gene_type:complete
MSDVLLEISGLSRCFPAGDDQLTVLNNVNLTIRRGEMIAIMGASGSGKSTLMNILGCLDTPSEGTYLVNGRDTSVMNPDQLAELRRDYFGFIFQRYHLLDDLTAIGNVEIPALYSAENKASRQARAEQLLKRLGLAERMDHKPSQLSGGQQQRVSVARALINGGTVILADEPTGALDSHSGKEMMDLLRELHQQGHTIVLVTHDPKIAASAERVIEISDGEIVSDITSGANNDSASTEYSATRIEEKQSVNKPISKPFSAQWFSVVEAFKMSLSAMGSHRLRTFLTMLGIIIGIASVVSVVAIGNGSQAQVLSRMASMGTNTIEIKPGSGLGDRRAGRVRTLTANDANALTNLSFVDSVTPTVRVNVAVRYGNEAVTAEVQGVGSDYFRVRGFEVAQGQLFDDGSIDALEQVAVIDNNTLNDLFPDGEALGKVIFLGRLPVRIIAVTEAREMAFGNSDALNVWLPYSTVNSRIYSQNYVNDITVRVSDEVSSTAAEQAIINLIKMRHGVEDFFTVNTDTVRENIEQTSSTMTLLISAIAFISLVVGGIGVMNIMLVSVTERTREIGIRMAVGARQADILRQFLIEAVLVCLCGGALGIGLAYAVGLIVSSTSSGLSMIYSTNSIIAAFICSTLIGVLFGFLPARNAARLNPVDALSRG